jgi:hypothetical protein
MGCAANRRVAIRGGNWNNGALAGLFAVNVNNLRSNTNTNIGARPALDLFHRPEAESSWAF